MMMITILNEEYLSSADLLIKVQLIVALDEQMEVATIVYGCNINKKPSYCWESQPSVAIFRT